MINKKHRLTRGDIDDIKKSPLKHRSGGMLALYKKSNDAKFKIAVVVSKKIDSRAVERNKQKRIIMSMVLKHINKLSNHPLSIMLYPSKEFLRHSSEEKNKIVANILEAACSKI